MATTPTSNIFRYGMYRMEPSPNLARRYQIFQIWIRPGAAGHGEVRAAPGAL